MTKMRLAVLCCIAGGAAQLVAGGVAATVPALGMESAPVAAWSMLLVVVHVTRVLGVLGLVWSGRAGPGRPARIGLWTATAGMALYVPAELLYLLSPQTTDALFFIGTLLAGVGLLVAGVVVLRAGTWTGPGRLTPLLTGGYVFAVLFPAFALGPVGAVLAIGGWGVCWILLGLALWTPATVAAVPAMAGGVR